MDDAELTQRDKEIIKELRRSNGRTRSVVEQKALQFRQDAEWCRNRGIEPMNPRDPRMFRGSKTVNYDDPDEVIAAVTAYKWFFCGNYYI